MDNFTENVICIAELCSAIDSPIKLAIIKYLCGLDHCFHGNLGEVLPYDQQAVHTAVDELFEEKVLIGENKCGQSCYCVNKSYFDRLKAVTSQALNLDAACCGEA